MRRVTRESLAAEVQASLDDKQAAANWKQQEGNLQVEAEWKTARQTSLLRAVLTTLKHMMGDRERCMYCLDSHGTDIEHFWPKMPYPERLFWWPNLLLCCTECGRLKGSQFPLASGQPLLVDPTQEDPWLYLDFDPTTGNLVARFNLNAGDWSAKGLKTVAILQLDRREALAVGYLKTYRRLLSIVEHHLADGTLTTTSLVDALLEADEHGLLGWCLLGTGQTLPPFSDLHTLRPDIWADCVAAL